MIRAGFLKPPLDVDVYPRPIADQNRGCNRRAALAARPEMAFQGRTDASAQDGRNLLVPRAAVDDVNERGTLDVADQGDSAPREHSLVVWDAFRS